MITKQAGKFVVAFVVFSFFWSPDVYAQQKAYPEKEIKFLVGFTPGSALDLSVRAVSKVATKYLGKPLVVVNMPGAAQTVALNELVRSAPDGYTIAMTTNTYKVLTAHEQKMPFDPSLLKTVMGYAEFRHVLFVKGDSPFSTVEDLIAYGRKNPGAIKFGHSGRGVVPHLMGLIFFREAKVRAIDVPYTGSAEYIQAVIGGHIPTGIAEISGMKSLVQAGTVKLLLTYTDRRLKEFPSVPTAKEKGYADLNPFNSLISVCVRRDTPADKINTLNEAFKKGVEDPEYAKMLDEMGLVGRYMSAQMVDESTRKLDALATPLLKELNLFVQ